MEVDLRHVAREGEAQEGVRVCVSVWYHGKDNRKVVDQVNTESRHRVSQWMDGWALLVADLSESKRSGKDQGGGLLVAHLWVEQHDLEGDLEARALGRHPLGRLDPLGRYES